jgi:3-phosphoshikimate 1-carboxyvinyltransferase
MRWIKPSRIEGRVAAPPSKSMMLRAVAAAVLAEDETVIRNPSFCADALAGLRIAGILGRDVRRDARIVRIGAEGSRRSGRRLPCGESGLCMRMFAPIAALSDRPHRLDGTGSLLRRPMGFMEGPLGELGASCRTADGLPPVRITGPLRGGRVAVDGSLSSQFLTGLLLALPFAAGDSEILVANLRSGPYAAMTVAFLRSFGLAIEAGDSLDHIQIAGRQRFRGIDYSVEGDWSGAAFLLVAGALAGRVEVSGLEPDSLQPDRAILEALSLAGARILQSDRRIVVEQDRLAGFDFDATDCPDLIPPLAALACHCEGRTRIFGADRLAHKESDRAGALVSEFSKAGAKIAVRGNRLEIGGGPLRAATLDSHGDHRIAMAGAVAALRSERGLGIEGGDCVAKSYPGFFDELNNVGGHIE